jgi:dethiobiotin synthetase
VSSFALAEYVNDRPYVASSFLCVALVSVFKTAMAGTCKGYEELAASAIPLEASLPAVPARGGEALVRRLFEPLGYDVGVTPVALDPNFPDWGDSRHVGLQLSGELRLADLLNHLYVLLPVLDDDKHYWVGEAEIEKLMRRGEGWLSVHPERDLIVRRYLKKQARLYFPALAQLDEAAPPVEEPDEPGREEQLEERVSLRDQRLGTVQSVLKASGARRVLDLGCGPGALLERLLREDYEFIVGADVSVRALEQAARRLKLDEMVSRRGKPKQQDRQPQLTARMRHVYLAATGQNRGKTTVSLGVLDGFQRRGLSTAFLKPVGQRTIIEDGVPADEDAVLMKHVFGLPEPLQQMSPVHIPRGFTQAYIEGEVVEDLPSRIRTAHAAFAERDILLIEGTGHAGVGAVIGLSNATVASMLGTPAVIVSEGGVGRPIDEIVLNAALFERQGVKVAGAIVNKVDLDAKVKEVAASDLAQAKNKKTMPKKK